MGWSVKGYRPNRPRPFTEYVDGKPVRKRLAPREPGYRLGGLLTRTVIGVRKTWPTPERVLRFERHTWSQDYVLHPTKGYRVASKVRKTAETSKNSRLPKDWRLGVHHHETFKRNGGSNEIV